MKNEQILVDDADIEIYPFYFANFIITAINYEWALTAARTINHSNFWWISEQLEKNLEIKEERFYFQPRIGIDLRLEHNETPDYRPGFSLLIGACDISTIQIEVLKRLYALNCPTASIYDGFSKEEEPLARVPTQKIVQIFSNYAIKTKIGREIVWSLPTSEGVACRVQTEFKIKRGYIGASLLIAGLEQKTTLKATMDAVDTIQSYEGVFCPFPAGIARLGIQMRGLDRYCPVLVEKVPQSHIPSGIKAVYEIEINGLSIESIKKAIKAGIQVASQNEGIKQIMVPDPLNKEHGKKIPIRTIL
ncbi:MAG: hypothetical protein ACTSRS_14555 [Candidatus Helarchaeota archaeon]